jgi:hypothetical protein
MEFIDGVNEALWQVVEEKISRQRMANYLVQAKGDQSLAIRLYEWNNHFSASIWQLLSVLEVGVRNSLDSRMRERQIRFHREEHWIFDDHYELGRSRDPLVSSKQPFRDIEEARLRVKKNRKAETPSQIISETSFGFWNQLIGKKNQFLWPDLAAAFPYAPTRDQKYISTLFTDLRAIRNRIGHHHQLHPESIANAELMVFELAKAVDPTFEEWIRSFSRVEAVKSTHPLGI